MRSSATAALFLLATSLLAQEAMPPRALDYDSKAPLDIQEVGVEHRRNVTVHDLSYASPKGGRVPVDPSLISGIPDLPQPPEPKL